MSQRMDLCVGRQGKDGKTHWTKVGAAFPQRSGSGFNLVIDPGVSILSAEGVSICLFPPRENAGRSQSQRGQDDDAWNDR